MARSCRKLKLLLAVALASGAAAAPAPPAALQPGQPPINLEATSTEVDGRTNTLVFSDVVISQGATRVQADHAHATGLNFANSRWTFEGKVRIDAEQHGNLRSDQAAIGRAGEIVYDLNDGTVRLTSQAWLTDGQNEISGPLLVYNIREQRVQAAASPGTDQRVHIRIAPRGVPGPGKTEPAKPPPPDAGEGDAAKPQPTP